MEFLTIELGRALRRARARRGLTLRQAELASGGRYKPSSIASYERGERKISVERLCDLATFLGADPGRLVTEAVEMASIRQSGGVTLDADRLTIILPELDEKERDVLELHVRTPSEDREGGTIVLSADDVDRLADESGRSAEEFLTAVRPARSE
jgi:transcriptional regulator with XRE-family HTH domain